MFSITFTSIEREIAGHYHSGQFSELYKVSSSGQYDSESALSFELRSAIRIAETNQDIEDIEVLSNMRARLLEELDKAY